MLLADVGGEKFERRLRAFVQRCRRHQSFSSPSKTLLYETRSEREREACLRHAHAFANGALFV
ncbi:MAG: hypothetical protein KME22_22970 [Hassallia sp. WJT32-NPBG1]|nr:hypothetical protein [Hassallia sp. WJT32-NPBG1]